MKTCKEWDYTNKVKALGLFGALKASEGAAHHAAIMPPLQVLRFHS